jgi:hypothetical protein
MGLSRRSFLRVAGGSLLTLVAAPTVAAKALAEKSGGVVLATQNDALKEIERFEATKKMEQYLKDPESFALMPPNKLERYICLGLQAVALKDINVPVSFDIKVNPAHMDIDSIGANPGWYNIGGSSHYPGINSNECRFFFSIGPLFTESEEFRQAVLTDAWKQVKLHKYSGNELMDAHKWGGRQINKYILEHGLHRYDGKPEHEVVLDKVLKFNRRAAKQYKRGKIS